MASRSTRNSTKQKSETSFAQASTASKTGRKRARKATDSTPKIDTQDLAKSDEPLKVEEETGDIFDAPANTLIIHACNCQGSWGAGIAKAFHDRYPEAYEEYTELCKEEGNELLDRAQLIQPIDHQSSEDTPKHFVGCLYTSRYYGQRKDKPARILQATKPAMEDLLSQVDEFNAKAKEGDKIEEVRICRINSGLFRVPWESTKSVLESIDVSKHDVKKVKVVSPPG